MSTARTIQEWPLSKVELITNNDTTYIRKSVHRDFADEALKQQAISEVVKSFSVPRILSSELIEDLSVFTMEYFEPTRQATADEADELIKQFHNETQELINNPLFPEYTIDSLLRDIDTLASYGLPSEINDINFFKDIFTDKVVLHNDWSLDQIIISDDKTVMIDFCKALIGPSILDQAHRIRFDTDSYQDVQDELLVKAFIVVDIMRIAWFDLCKRQYIDYSYEAEIKSSLDVIHYNVQKLLVT